MVGHDPGIERPVIQRPYWVVHHTFWLGNHVYFARGGGWIFKELLCSLTLVMNPPIGRKRTLRQADHIQCVLDLEELSLLNVESAVPPAAVSSYLGTVPLRQSPIIVIWPSRYYFEGEII